MPTLCISIANACHKSATNERGSGFLDKKAVNSEIYRLDDLISFHFVLSQTPLFSALGGPPRILGHILVCVDRIVR